MPGNDYRKLHITDNNMKILHSFYVTWIVQKLTLKMKKKCVIFSEKIQL